MTITNERETVQSSINEKAFFSAMKHLFASSFSVLAELMQNARRAGASSVKFTLDRENKRLTVEDDGNGISNFGALITLCVSGWDDKTQLEESPFGMGFFSTLYACERVTIQSRSKQLVVSRKDVESRKELIVESDSNQRSGTIITLDGLDSNLLQLVNKQCSGDVKVTRAYKHVVGFAKGFGIDVYFDGELLPRPHAKSNLAGEHTAIGFVSNPVIDGGYGEKSLTAEWYSYYLQGLPIQHDGNASNDHVIHLSETAFKPVMPDRTRLYNDADAQFTIKTTLKERCRSFIAKEKLRLDGQAFVNRYFTSVLELDCAALLNDIAYLPATCFRTVDRVSRGSEGFTTCYDNLVSKNDMTSGRTKVWRDLSMHGDAVDWAVLQAVAEIENVRFFSDPGLDQDHWIHRFTPTAQDFVTEVLVNGKSAEGSHGVNCSEIKINLCESVDIHVTSSTDPSFVIRLNVFDRPIAAGVTPADEDVYSDDYVVFIPTRAGFGSAIVEVFDNFCNEWGDPNESQEEEAKEEWRQAVAALRCDSVPAQCHRARYELSQICSCKDDAPVSGALLVRAGTGFGGSSAISVVDLDGPALWESVLAKLTSNTDGLTAEHLKECFFKASIEATLAKQLAEPT